jgi:hypothetical protein
MYLTKKMLDNGYTGVGEQADEVAEYSVGKRNGVVVTLDGAAEYRNDSIIGAFITQNGEIIYEGKKIVEAHDEGVWVGGDFGILIRDDGTIEVKFKK